MANQFVASDPTRDLRGALSKRKQKHHAAILEPAKAGEMLRAIDGYEGHPLTRIALQLSALLSAYLSRFNPIRIMKMEGMEIRHSAILGWLLDPRETHGLGERFLKAFIGEAMRGQSWLDRPTALEVMQADLSDVEIRREWQHIDILIFSARQAALDRRSRPH